MGMYVNKTPNGFLGASFKDKCEGLLKAGAVWVEQPTEWIPNLICVVDNRYFGAAAHLYKPSELDAFTDPSDDRKKAFFTWDLAEQYAE